MEGAMPIPLGPPAPAQHPFPGDAECVPRDGATWCSPLSDSHQRGSGRQLGSGQGWGTYLGSFPGLLCSRLLGFTQDTQACPAHLHCAWDCGFRLPSVSATGSQQLLLGSVGRSSGSSPFPWMPTEFHSRITFGERPVPQVLMGHAHATSTQTTEQATEPGGPALCSPQSLPTPKGNCSSGLRMRSACF